MTETDARGRRGVAFAGFLVPSALLAFLALAYWQQYFAGLGWRGGEYAHAFIGVAVGAVLLGCLLKLLRPPWNSFGSGLVVGGLLGIVAVIAIVVLFLVAVSRAQALP